MVRAREFELQELEERARDEELRKYREQDEQEKRFYQKLNIERQWKKIQASWGLLRPRWCTCYRVRFVSLNDLETIFTFPKEFLNQAGIGRKFLNNERILAQRKVNLRADVKCDLGGRPV